ncbi:porin family protein [Flavobacterium sp. 1355]|uniref:porin family protein n=1 Tax=Flavobacterium sp. 1355 TaxID=2806571 RepID=UPI001AE1B895|nr:porin family protein [Flavobacterium sp. 1355]MBP1224737.1 opacity protein-like surface antigen [Flavobacterium sp. 1355]
MKKNILIIAAVLMFGLSNAQEAKFGLKGGLNISNFSGDTEGIDFKSRIGFNVGAFLEIKLSDKFAIQPEVLYATQGATADDFVDLESGITGDVAFKLNYINIPVMFKYYVAEKFNIEAGPQIGFLTSAKTTTKLNGYSGKHDMDVKDMFESIDFGLNFGAEYDFTEHISAGLRYNLGLANIAKTEEEDDSKVHNGVFSLSIGYKF